MRLCLLALLALTACQYEQIDTTDPVGPMQPVSYLNDIQPIFSQSCGGGGCHVGEATFGANLTTYAETMASRGQQYGVLIVKPGDANGSPLVDKLLPQPDHGVRMPLGRSALAPADITLIRAWIDEGASDN